MKAQFAEHKWTQPLELAKHRQALIQIDLDRTIYPVTFSYSDDGLEPYLARVGEIEDIIRSCRDLGHVSDCIAEQLQRDRLAATAVQARHDPTFSTSQRELHGIPHDEIVNKAKQSLKLSNSEADTASPEREQISAEELLLRMTGVLQCYGLTDWHVQIEENMASKASVNGSIRRVRLRGNSVFSSFDANRLIVHEIGGHVLRFANSERQSEPWAKIPMGRTVPTEEGLAICGESEFGLLDQKVIHKYQVRCLAVSVAAQGGIMDVLRSISPYVDRGEAAEIAIRTKRGLVDPNAPGGSTKDWAYFDGYLRMQELRESSPFDFQLLRGVKWPVEDLPLIRDLFEEGRIGEPLLVPDREKLGLSN
jgi:hypothetical protein